MKRPLLFLFMVMFCLHSNAQDPQFSQAFSNPIYLNPAFAGYEGCPRINSGYRLQWPNISGRFHNMNLSYDQLFGKMHGVAINYDFDIGGETLQTHAISLTYSPLIRFFKDKLIVSPAIQLGWRANYIDWDKLTFGDMVDPRYGFVYTPNMVPPETESHMFDLTAGIILSHHNLVYGAAFHHVTQPNEGFSGYSRLPVKFSGHISYTRVISERFKIAASFVGQKQQDFTSFLPAISFFAYGGRIGIAYRTNINNPDAVIFMAGYQGKAFKVGYSYDYTISSLTNNTGGSHEVSLAYVFNCKKKEFRKGVQQITF